MTLGGEGQDKTMPGIGRLDPMRVARYALAGSDPAFGIVELGEDHGQFPDTIAAITGDPLAGPVSYTGERHPLGEVRLLAPVIPRSKVLGIGRNYADPAAPDAQVPGPPVTFFKPNTTVIGPDDAIIRPTEVTELNFESELAIVIGRISRKVPAKRAQEVIFGYTVGNDVTAANLQQREPQWTRAKGFDTFTPLGPWIVTHLSIEEASNLAVSSTLDGEVRQQGNTNQMMRGIAELVAYFSNFSTLLPGDVILTGTPAGASQMLPLQHISCEIAGIGALHNVVVADDPGNFGEPA